VRGRRIPWNPRGCESNFAVLDDLVPWMCTALPPTEGQFANRPPCAQRLIEEEAVFGNVRWEAVFALVFAFFGCFVVGLVLWIWMLWLLGLLGLVIIASDIAWTILAFLRAKRAGQSKLKF